MIEERAPIHGPSSNKYLIVVPVEAYPLGEGKAAMESAFCRHLRELLALSSPPFEAMTVATTRMPKERYEASRDGLDVLDPEQDRIRVAPLYDADLGTPAFVKKLPEILRELRALVRDHALVHSGPSHDLRRPVTAAALAMAVRGHTPTISISDIDLRSDAEMNYRLGRWSLKSYLVCRYLYDPIRDLQHRWIARSCSLVLFKSEAQRRDYGDGLPNVRTFQDVAFDLDHVIADDELSAKIVRLRDPRNALDVVYFGRLVPYKGVDRCIAAMERARALGRDDVRLTVIGTGEQETELRELAAARGLSDHVTFRGAVPYGDQLFADVRPRHLAMAAPLSNDTPRSAWDAMAAGVPLLAFGTDYYRDLEERTGAVETVPWPSVDALGDRLAQYASNRDALVPKMEAAVRTARENTAETWLRRRVDWTRELLPANV